MKAPISKRVLTGDTPTGKLHLGHYVGTLENRVRLQDEYQTFIILADTHALSTLAKTPRVIGSHTREVALGNLAAGVSPEKATFFAESLVPELYELAAIFSMYVTHSRALRNPTVKDEIKMKGLGDVFSLGFVNYPVFQAADILCVKGNLVPVGVDQVAHLEQTREIARDINEAAGSEIFPVPEALVGRVGKLIGTDGNPKMSKSLGNTIFLDESKEEVERKVRDMYTDPKRVSADIPGTVEGNPVFVYLDAFGDEGDKDQIAEYKDRYQAGKVGDVEVKRFLSDVLNRFLEPMRERRKEYESRDGFVDELIKEGSERVRGIARQTLEEVRSGLGFIL
jgi:tryptophanyl-tRNA synthetase